MEASKRDSAPASTAPPEALEQAAQGHKLDRDDEKSVLDYLVGATHRPESYVDVQLDTKGGRKRLRVHLRSLDERKMDEIDRAHRTGDPPFQQLDMAAFNAAMVAEACTAFEDPETGGRVNPNTPDFIGQAPNLEVAMEARFRFQPGLLSSLAEEVRRLSAYSPDRVGSSQRMIQTAVGNSSGGTG
jgi:hypothetical protein